MKWDVRKTADGQYVLLVTEKRNKRTRNVRFTGTSREMFETAALMSRASKHLAEEDPLIADMLEHLALERLKALVTSIVISFAQSFDCAKDISEEARCTTELGIAAATEFLKNAGER